MLRAAWLIGLCAPFVIACGVAGDGTVEGCMGSYSGPFSGGEEGIVSATYRQGGILKTTFVRTNPREIHAVTATVTDSGALSSSGGAFVMSGMFDLDECTATGTWNGASGTGMFSLSKH